MAKSHDQFLRQQVNVPNAIEWALTYEHAGPYLVAALGSDIMDYGIAAVEKTWGPALIEAYARWRNARKGLSTDER